MKKIFALFIIITTLLAACQPTPEEVIVKSKVDDNYMDKIEEGQGAEKAEKNAQESIVAQTQKWTETIEAKDKILSVVINADVKIPDAESFPVVQLLPAKITQEQVDSFLNRFFPGRYGFESDQISQIPTKSEIEATILMLREWIATKEKNTDNIGKTNHERWQEEIDFYMEQMEDAPEEDAEMVYDITKFSIYPLMEVNWEEGETIKEMNEKLEEMKNRAWEDDRELIEYYFKDKSDRYRVYALKSDTPHVNALGISSESKFNIRAGIENYADIPGLNTSNAQAKAMADEAAAVLGLNYMEAAFSSVGTYIISVSSFGKDVIEKELYHFGYSRAINGVPHTYTQNIIQWSQAQSQPWAYEYFDIWIDDDGIQAAILSSCPSAAGQVLSENAPLLSFETIQEKARHSFSLGIFAHSRNSYGAAQMIAENRATVHENNIIIDKVELGYMRVKQGTGADDYIMIPVWDFIGRESIRMDVVNKKSGESHTAETEMPEYTDRHSFLTINAIDGSIIDRSLGY